MVNNNKYPIIVAGAGIGGLATALALKRKGFDVEVYERRDNLLEKRGTALNIWSNAIIALKHIQLDTTVLNQGTPITRSTVTTLKGQTLIETPIGEISKQLGTPSINLRRSDLIRIIYDACADIDIPIHSGSQCIGYSEEKDNITLHLKDGKNIKGCVLIGADGIRSVVRAQLIGDGEPTYLGYSIWRGISEKQVNELEPGHMSFFWGKRSIRGGCWPVDRDHVSWTLGMKAPPGEKNESVQVKSFLLKLVDNSPETFKKAIELTPEKNIFRIDAYARENADIWGKNRITLLGDAAHASPTVYGQGACQALEDAVIIAESLENAPDIITGLRWYEERRKKRVNWIRSKIFDGVKAHNIDNPVYCWLRNLYVRYFFSQEKSNITWRKMLTFEG